MSHVIDRSTPCTATVTPDDNGGIAIGLSVPTYSGGVQLTLSVERDADGNWRVFLPLWPDHDNPEVVEDGRGRTYDVAGGICYLSAPDVEVEAS